jgi:hypothetical protein
MSLRALLRPVTAVLVAALAAALFVVVSATEHPTPTVIRPSDTSTQVTANVAWVKPFMTRRCRTVRGFNCYHIDPNPKRPDWSFYSIPIGRNRKCLQFRAPAVNKTYGFCTKPDARRAALSPRLLDAFRANVTPAR